YSITGNSSVINAFNDPGTGAINLNQPQPTETTIHQEGGGRKSSPTLKLVDLYDEKSYEADKIASDLSIHQHPRRTCEYTCTFTNSDEEKEKEEDVTKFKNTSKSEWMLDGVYIFDLCLNSKKTNLKLAERTDPVQLSDIRLLTL
ncbi:uncharacterized protein B0P05DRAFT_458597, partial [Gilbertella persicaria]|uniref:uncharacterized protein n=1 Tax=Gilbertella persicaria TaxID=101096 RepID=UPI00221E4382